MFLNDESENDSHESTSQGLTSGVLGSRISSRVSQPSAQLSNALAMKRGSLQRGDLHDGGARAIELAEKFHIASGSNGDSVGSSASKSTGAWTTARAMPTIAAARRKAAMNRSFLATDLKAVKDVGDHALTFFCGQVFITQR